MAYNVWSIIEEAKKLPEDTIVYVFAHDEDFFDAQGQRRTRIKTLGKLLSEKVTLESLVSIVLFTKVSHDNEKSEYTFTTQNDGTNTAKSPADMFESFEIENNLKLVNDKIREYYGV